MHSNRARISNTVEICINSTSHNSKYALLAVHMGIVLFQQEVRGTLNMKGISLFS